MTPASFAGQNVVFAKDQPEYLPLPARREADGTVTTCWAFSWRERLAVLFRGRLFLDVLTFNHPLQPLRPYVEPPKESA